MPNEGFILTTIEMIKMFRSLVYIEGVGLSEQKKIIEEFQKLISHNKIDNLEDFQMFLKLILRMNKGEILYRNNKLIITTTHEVGINDIY